MSFVMGDAFGVRLILGNGAFTGVAARLMARLIGLGAGAMRTGADLEPASAQIRFVCQY